MNITQKLRLKMAGYSRILIYVPSLILLLSTFGLFFYVQARERACIDILLQDKLKSVSSLFEKQLQSYIDVAQHFRGEVSISGGVTQENFRKFAHDLVAEHPDMQSVEWGALVDAKDRLGFEQKMQQLYGREVLITEYNRQDERVPSASKAEYLPVTYVYPLAQHKTTLGFDVNSELSQFHALSRARASGKTMLQVSDEHHTKSQDGQDNFYIINYIPFYHSESGEQERDNAFIGYLAQIISLKPFVEKILAQSHMENINLSLLDTTQEQAVLIYQQLGRDDTASIAQAVAQEVSLANKVWMINLHATPAFVAKIQAPTSWGILLLGLLCTVIVMLMQRVYIQSNASLRQQLANYLEDLHASEVNANLLAVTFETHQAILITDPEAKILRVNKAFTEITGYAEHEVIGRNPRILSSGRQNSEFYRDMWSALLETGKFESEIWNRNKGGAVFLERQTITAVKNAQGHTAYFVSVFADITLQKQAEERIKYFAFYDPLTLLPNRRLLVDRLEQALIHAQRAQTSGAVIAIDLDNFKEINDRLGYQYGDEVLIQFAQRLTQLLRKSDTVARLEGDKFVLILPTEKKGQRLTLEHAMSVTEKILLDSQQSFILKESEYPITVSIGISLMEADSFRATDILRQADVAMYRAKAKGKHGFCFYQDAMQILVEKNQSRNK
ncbi:MAG: diguanylate cyclase [Methyloprofundus sp.]|nr:diguanylate cyclase [Methyloprofundus sp.]